MNNINLYITTNQNKLTKENINDIDLLIFSELIYFKQINKLVFEYKVENFKIGDLAYFAPSINGDKYKEFLTLLTSSNRFNDIRISNVENVFDEQRSTQFFAMTYAFDDVVVITYRGTDGTYVGWKENFISTYKEYTESQNMSRIYLERVITKYPNSKFYVCGHSKGGNLAEYAAVTANIDKSNIIKVISFDGQGFSSEFVTSNKFLEIENKITKYSPSNSVVGKLFYDKDIISIKAYENTFRQHDPFNFVVSKNGFESDYVSNSSVKLGHEFNSFVSNLTKEELEFFVNTVFDMFKGQEIDSVFNLVKDPLVLMQVYLKVSQISLNVKNNFTKLVSQLKEYALY